MVRLRAALFLLCVVVSSTSTLASADNAFSDLLADLDLAQFAHAFEANGITTIETLGMLEHEKHDRALADMGLSLGRRIRLLNRAAELRAAKQSTAAVESTSNKHQATAAIVAEMLEAHTEKMEKMLDTARALINEAQLHSAPAPPAVARRRELEQSGGAAPEGASLWVEDDDGRIVFGASSDTDLSRGGANILSTSGGLQIGSVDDLTCDADTNAVLRWPVVILQRTFRLGALLFTAISWIFIPAYCFAIP